MSEEKASPGPWRVVHVVYRRPLREFWILERDTESGPEKMLNEAGRVKRLRSERTALQERDRANGAAPAAQAQHDS